MEAAARDLERFKGLKFLKAGKTAGLNALRTEGYAVEANGRRQRWNSKGL